MRSSASQASGRLVLAAHDDELEAQLLLGAGGAPPAASQGSVGGGRWRALRDTDGDGTPDHLELQLRPSSSAAPAAAAASERVGAREGGGEAAMAEGGRGSGGGLLHLGRTSYMLQAVDGATGRQRWNVSVAVLRPLGVGDPPQQRGDETRARGGDGGGDEGHGGGIPRLVVGPGNVLRAYFGADDGSPLPPAGGSGELAWTAWLPAAPAGAFMRRAFPSDASSWEQLYPPPVAPSSSAGPFGGVGGSGHGEQRDSVLGPSSSASTSALVPFDGFEAGPPPRGGGETTPAPAEVVLVGVMPAGGGLFALPAPVSGVVGDGDEPQSMLPPLLTLPSPSPEDGGADEAGFKWAPGSPRAAGSASSSSSSSSAVSLMPMLVSGVAAGWEPACAPNRPSGALQQRLPGSSRRPYEEEEEDGYGSSLGYNGRPPLALPAAHSPRGAAVAAALGWVGLGALVAAAALAAALVVPPSLARAPWGLRLRHGATVAAPLANGHERNLTPAGDSGEALSSPPPATNEDGSSAQLQQRAAKRKKGKKGRRPAGEGEQEGEQEVAAEAVSRQGSGGKSRHSNSAEDGEQQRASTPPSSEAEPPPAAPLLLPPATSSSVTSPDGVTRIGKMEVGPGILGYGSGGTIVFEGRLSGRPVAVKRIVRHYVGLASKEIAALIAADDHPNVVRCFAHEEDPHFVYLALERCARSLAQRVESPQPDDPPLLDPGAGGGRPTDAAMRLMWDVARGLAWLHGLGIVHRDLKPANILVTAAGHAKLSDMVRLSLEGGGPAATTRLKVDRLLTPAAPPSPAQGLCKVLSEEQSSFTTLGAGGSAGWTAPEILASTQLLEAVGSSDSSTPPQNKLAHGSQALRQTRAVDSFSLGLILHYGLTGGRHPFGERHARDAAVLAGAPPDLSALSQLPEVWPANFPPGLARWSGRPGPPSPA